MATDFAFDAEATDVWSRSNITMTAIQNLTIFPTNFSFADLSSQINSTRSVINIVKGFEPTQRFNSDFNSTLVRRAYVGNCSLKRVDDELLLFLNASSGDNAAIATYNLSFTNPVQISGSDFISFALSNSSTYNGSEAYIGVSLLLRDQQGTRHYISIQISDQYSEDSFSLNEWFLGWSFGEDYPRYTMRYNSTSGPWFIQLPLSNSFTSLNLPSAWLDGLLIGGEIYSKPPFDIEEITEVNTRFHYVLVHKQPFSINQEIVNSTMMVFPFANSLSFSGILSERVNVTVEGLLKPGYNKEERRENETVNIRETFFNLSETFESEVSVQKEVEITVPTGTVKKCTLTLNNNTIKDLTDALLQSNSVIYRFPWNTTLVKIHLTLYRFNAWFFEMNPFIGAPYRITKKGIVEEYFSPDKNEVTININSSESSSVNLATRSGNLIPVEITSNGSKKPLESLLILNKQNYWAISIAVPEENASIYTVKYILSDGPLYQSLTTTPFSVRIDNHVFEIFTPFNIEGQEGTLIPLTIRTYTTPRTYTLKIEYDSSMFEADRDEIMVYASRFHYEYFMLKPLRTGQTTINLKIIDPITRDTFFSFPFFVSIKSSFLTQAAIYFLLGVAVFSLIYIFSKKSLIKWISRFRHYARAKKSFSSR